MKATSELFLSDLHFPDIDSACWRMALAIAKKFQPSLVWLNGDFLDFKSVSRFLVDPTQRFVAHRCLASAKQALVELRKAAPKARLVFREGNHDRRLQRYITEKAPELAFLEELRLPNLLQLKAVDCEFKGSDDRTKVGELWHIHGDELPTGRVFPARKALERAHCNLIFGHIHRFSVACESSLSGRNHIAWSIGCLQNLQVDYDYHPEWQQGVAWIDYTPSGLFNVTPVLMFNDEGKKKCMLGGQLFTA